jgi:TolA-binding protein
MANGCARSSSDDQQTALLEALRRGDEFADALRAVGAELEATRRQLTVAEETVAELNEVNEAAQVAIDQLRARISAAEDRFENFLRQRDALAAELFDMVRQCEATSAAEATTSGLDFPKVPEILRPNRRWWRPQSIASIQRWWRVIGRRAVPRMGRSETPKP